LEIKLIGKALNPILADMDVEIVQYFHDVLVWTKVEDYPPLIEIDTRLIAPNKPFKFIDLSYMLPEGVWLHKKYDRVLYNSIASMGENFNYFLSSNAYPIEDATNLSLDKEEETEETQEIKEIQELMTQAHQNKKKKKAVTMPFNAVSSKKMMQTKNEGADPKALRKLMLGGSKGGDKKGKGKK
jgi:predicted DNA binding CopG/RHH family protein